MNDWMCVFQCIMYFHVFSVVPVWFSLDPLLIRSSADFIR